MAAIVGIDLGTTYSEVAVLRDGQPEVVPVDGESIMPSCVGLDSQGALIVGRAARNQMVLAPEKTIILTTHNMDEADRLSDRVAIIDYGKLLVLDSPDNLKRSIGEGDILEFLFGEVDGETDNLIDGLSKIGCKVTISENLMFVQSKDIIKKVTQVTEIIRSEGLNIQEMTMRENSLEDVFIHLTGRKLRQ